MTQPKNKPVAEVKSGLIVASIWKNEGEKGSRFSVTFARIYKSDDQWKRTTSFGRDDLLILAKVADQAHSKIGELIAASRASQ